MIWVLPCTCYHNFRFTLYMLPRDDFHWPNPTRPDPSRTFLVTRRGYGYNIYKQEWWKAMPPNARPFAFPIGMHSFQIKISLLRPAQSQTLTLDFHSIGRGGGGVFSPCLLQRMRSRRKEEGFIITMSNRRRERRPLQRGRISTETIQAVQALKRAKNDPILLHRLFDSKVRRLIKFDLIALLRELQRQNEALLALQVPRYKKIN